MINRKNLPDYEASIKGLLQEKGFSGQELVDIVEINGDGSDRIFFRLAVPGRSMVAVFPSSSNPRAMGEAESCYRIGRHLLDRGIPVPEIIGYDEKNGLLLYEDLGSSHLHDFVTARNGVDEAVLGKYRETLVILARFQAAGAEGFDSGFCWDTSRYDRDLILDRETGYFQREFCVFFLGIEKKPSGIEDEFSRLAMKAEAGECGFIIHRDFQSRNIMLHQDAPRIIDFQGARFGPPAYDVASLLNDPYVCLPEDEKSGLIDLYMEAAAAYSKFDRGRFLENYYYVSLCRYLQILGAFSFLSGRMGKLFFRRYLDPALKSLYAHLRKDVGKEFPGLRALVDMCVEKLHDKQSD